MMWLGDLFLICFHAYLYFFHLTTYAFVKFWQAKKRKEKELGEKQISKQEFEEWEAEYKS